MAGYVGNPAGDSFFVGAENLHFLTALTHHSEKMALKARARHFCCHCHLTILLSSLLEVNLAWSNGQSDQYYYPDVKVDAETSLQGDTFTGIIFKTF